VQAWFEGKLTAPQAAAGLACKESALTYNSVRIVREGVKAGRVLFLGGIDEGLGEGRDEEMRIAPTEM